ncbi:CC/Se motif family (seleno)protein [Cytobacillus purgationiresistens]|uniref:Uncharacterized protein n=1 Tax=Cytobacillus purgationiresistens TaxID=863449 RepID=A0ABU0AJP4_9BACI|nr:CC/Se motif family (seleno)protein [Cytobacillus purgationiresistens]MDQ0271484.1 hypothetical protein [Cytobacillus purgationiresistens]
MEILIDSAAKKWIHAKGSHLTIKNLIVNSCCSPGIQDTIAVPGTPKDLNRFKKMVVEDIEIYLEKNIKIQGSVSIKLSGFGLLKSLSVTI